MNEQQAHPANNEGEINIFSLSASKKLTDEVCKILNIEPKRIDTIRFADGEILTQALDSVRGKDVYLIQSTNSPVNDNLMELLIAIDALKRGSAQTINVVLPYYGYARQDRKAKGRQPITAKLVADLLTTAGADRVITIDIHSQQIMGFFNIPMDNFSAAQTLAREIIDTIIDEHLDPKNCILVSPDHGGLTRVHKVDSYTGSMTDGVAVIAKRRPEPNKAEVEFVLGDIKGKTCFIVDDMIDTGGTIINGAKALKEAGAKEVYIFASHGVFSGQAPQKMEQAIKEGIIKQVVVTNTIDIPKDRQFKGLKVVSIAHMLADMIKASVNKHSLTQVYNDEQAEIFTHINRYLKKD
ncbi:ribose-phosphate pyrophosphokinase [Entomoplasma freundtii]|uniref:Ribose-phosphate pyrophosphokinase n=1 Tax=Entomoplasma freundtii TaxID=74700 RepID=A0A2K8NTJ0_9MOLU|nr:ribose-phosphate pyrophosphokinase [Entomoplasma freundtii]ATZ16071.1 ribose-phosphate pyrophosphokinase [Entomoplasma freundtii]TDY58060.1 ribose-phosphate pyrophosphokinase [Entomoplasma freundtii]